MIVAFFRRRRAELLKRWEEAMRALPSERGLSRQELIDDLPELLDRIAVIAEALSSGHTPPPPSAADVHGHHRVRSGVQLWEVVAELAMFRDLVFELWTADSKQVPSPELLSVHQAIDQAVMMSVESYVRERDRIQHELTRRAQERATALRRVEALVSSHPDFFYLLDRDHRFLYVSPSLLKLWGRTSDQAVGKTFEELGYPPELVELHARQLNDVLAGRTIRGENPYTDAAGNERQYEYIFVPVRGEDGAIDAIAGVTRDVTVQKQHEAALASAAASAEQLIAVLGHDLRTPLGSISMSAETMLRTGDLPERHERGLHRIERSAQRMARLVSDIVDWTRSRLGTELPIARERCDLGDACEQALGEIAVLHPERTITLDRGDGVVGCWDPDRMAQVVENLVSNAIAHGAPDSPIRLTILAHDDDAILRVHNQGEPIAPALLPRMFEPFAMDRPDRSGRGHLGLGLHIVRQIVHAHGGTIGVQSRQGGTTFSVRLPRKSPAC